jgi:hypothetical protein
MMTPTETSAALQDGHEQLDYARALEINGWMLTLFYASMGLKEGKEPTPRDAVKGLSKVSLEEMIAADRMVRAVNGAALAEQSRNGGSCSIRMVCDERLIAAIYVFLNYSSRKGGWGPDAFDDNIILSTPYGAGRVKALVLVQRDEEKDEEDDEAEAA